MLQKYLHYCFQFPLCQRQRTRKVIREDTQCSFIKCGGFAEVCARTFLLIKFDLHEDLAYFIEHLLHSTPLMFCDYVVRVRESNKCPEYELSSPAETFAKLLIARIHAGELMIDSSLSN